jgi:exonuclease VII large subunit
MAPDLKSFSILELKRRFEKLSERLDRLENDRLGRIEATMGSAEESFRDVKESRDKELVDAQKAFDEKKRAFEEISEQFFQAKVELDAAQERAREAQRLVSGIAKESTKEMVRLRKDMEKQMEQEIKEIRNELRQITQMLDKEDPGDSQENKE